MVETNLLVWLEQFEGDAQQRWADLEKRVRHEGVCRDVEFRLMTRGEDKWLNVNASLLERVADEEKGVIVSIWRDVTEWKQSQNLLQNYAEDLKQANEEVKQFAYIISHDLRAPLVNIKGYSAELRYAADEISSVLNSIIPSLDEGEP